MKLTCLVDNAVEPSSPFWGEHGLAFLIETRDGRVLFDTGASGELLLHNLKAAKVDPASISALALSHGHRDHTGGLAAFLERRGSLPVYYAHPDLLQERFSQRKGALEPIGLPMAAGALLRQQAELQLSPTPREILPGVWTSGEITARSEFEGRGTGHLVREGEELVPDPYRDDMALVLEGSEGLVLISGCAHAGILNILLQVQSNFGEAPVMLVGGMHLTSAGEQELHHLIEKLPRLGPPVLHPNHCTGWKACLVLAGALERVTPCPAGTVLEF